jgi:ankyrin repeat protein
MNKAMKKLLLTLTVCSGIIAQQGLVLAMKADSSNPTKYLDALSKVVKSISTAQILDGTEDPQEDSGQDDQDLPINERSAIPQALVQSKIIIDEESLSHIIDGSYGNGHRWEFLVSDKKRKDIKKIIQYVMRHGTDGEYKEVNCKTLIIDDIFKVQITYRETEKGVEVNDGWVNANDEPLTSDGSTPLMLACMTESLKTIDQLIQAKANLAVQDHDGHTALSLAILFNQTEIAKLLIDTIIHQKKFSIFNIRDDFGWSAYAALKNSAINDCSLLARRLDSNGAERCLAWCMPQPQDNTLKLNCFVDCLPLYEKVETENICKKLFLYSLNPTHKVGGDKAKDFKNQLGITRIHSHQLATQIKENLKHFHALLTKCDKPGRHYSVYMNVKGPNGKTAYVLTAWLVYPGCIGIHIVTCYVADPSAKQKVALAESYTPEKIIDLSRISISEDDEKEEKDEQ